MRFCFVALALVVAGRASAGDPLVFAPAEGETTNVTAFLTGTLDVSANPGASGGGTVRISGHYNNYVGTTANNCGILWPAFFGPDSSYGSLGACTGLTLGQGTLKYTGQAGVISAPVTHTGDANSYSVYEIGEGSDLTLTGAFSAAPRIVKSGKGTLRFAHDGDEQNWIALSGDAVGHCDSGTIYMNFKENGDAPTKGGAALTVADGTVVFEKGRYGFGSQSKGYGLRIGAWTAADGEQETAGRVEVRGGTLAKWVASGSGWWDVGMGDVMLGDRNGFTVTTPDYRPSPAFCIYDGLVYLTTVWFGRCYYDPPSGKKANCNPRFEMHGGTAYCNQCIVFQMGNQTGLLSEFIADGGHLYSTYLVYALHSGINTGNAAGDQSCTNLITISGTALVEFPKIVNNRNETTFVTLKDDGVFKAAYLSNNSGWMSLDFDGGTLLQRFSSAYALVSNNLSRVTVGARGGTIGALSSYVALVQKGFGPNPDLAETDGGLTIANDQATGIVRFSAANTYAGPTTLKLGTMEFVGDGLMSPNSRLVLEGGVANFANAQHTVAGLTVGKTAANTTEELRFDKSKPLIVNGDVKIKGEPVLTVVPLEANGLPSTAEGTYTVLTAPKAQKKILAALTARCVAPNLSAEFFNVVEDGDMVKLVIQVEDPGLDPVDPNYGYWTNPAGGAWSDSANWEDGNVAASYDMHAVFATAAQDGGATVVPSGTGVEVQSLEMTAGKYVIGGGTVKPMRVNLNENADLEFSGGAHDVDGTIYVGGGNGGATSPKLSVSGGSLTCDNLYLGYDTTKTQTESPIVEISGGVVTAKTGVVVDYHGGSASGTFTMTGGTLVTPSFKVGGAGAKADRTVNAAVLSFTNCKVDLGEGVFDGDTAGATPSSITFGEGGVIRAKKIDQSDTDSSKTLTFNGGTYVPTVATSDDNSGIVASYLFTGKVGTKGFTVDTSELPDEGEDIRNYVQIKMVLNGSGNKTFATGGRCVYFPGYGHSFYNGTIVATNGTTVIVKSPASQASPIEIEPGSALRFKDKAVEPYSKTVTLGRAGATDPVRLEFNNKDGFAEGSHQCTIDKLVVNSPVSVAWCAEGWQGVPTCPDGVYTSIVYKVSGSTVDAAQFALPAKFQSWKALKTEIVAYDATQNAIVFTVTTTGEEPVPPPPEPVVIPSLTVTADNPVTLGDGTTVGSLTVAAGSWNTALVTGSFFVRDAFSLGLLPGEIASARVDGDVTIKSDAVWAVDYDTDGKAADLLVVNGKLTVEKGATLDFGRTDANPLPRHFRAPIACATGAIAVPARVAATGTGGLCESMELTVENGVLYASEPKRGLMILVR